MNYSSPKVMDSSSSNSIISLTSSSFSGLICAPLYRLERRLLAAPKPGTKASNRSFSCNPIDSNRVDVILFFLLSVSRCFRTEECSEDYMSDGVMRVWIR